MPQTTLTATVTVTDTGGHVASVQTSCFIGGYLEPTKTTVGLLPGVARDTPNVGATVNLSTPGQVYENHNLPGSRISVSAANVTIRNVYVGGGATPNGALITATNAAVDTLVIQNCELAPSPGSSPVWNGVAGHDFQVYDTYIHHCNDSIQIKPTGSVTSFYNSGVILEHNLFDDLSWMTAATPGVVHTTDTESHNDHVQLFGGNGTIIRWNAFHGRFARQYGHWYVTDPTTEPYTTVPLHSLADGGPHQHIPDRDLISGSPSANHIINGQPSNESNGRYNSDDCSNLMFNPGPGSAAVPCTETVVEDNWFYGGNYSVNGGGNPKNGSTRMYASFKRNKFSRDQGSQGSGGNTTQTINLQAGWGSAAFDIPLTGPDCNVYMDDLSPVTVRI